MFVLWIIGKAKELKYIAIGIRLTNNLLNKQKLTLNFRNLIKYLRKPSSDPHQNEMELCRVTNYANYSNLLTI